MKGCKRHSNKPKTMTTTNKETLSASVIYTAMWNLPGHLPDTEPFRTLSESDAREYLADELDREADDSESNKRAQAFGEAAMVIRSGDADGVGIEDFAYSIEKGEPIDDEEARRAAVAIVSGDDLGDVDALSYGENGFAIGGGAEYLCLTEEEADQLWDEYLDSYIDDCGLLDEMPESLQVYFDREAWKRDARMDGRGHSLSGYDGHEHEEGDFFIYRTN